MAHHRARADAPQQVEERVDATSWSRRLLAFRPRHARVRGRPRWYTHGVGGPAKTRRADAELKAELEALPGNVKGEIIDGELHVMPRPRPRRMRVASVLGRHIGGSFDHDDEGPHPA